MFFTEAERLFWAFLLYLSGVQGKPNSICALKGSSVKMQCSDQHPTSSMNWYTAYRGGSKIQPSAEETRGKYSVSADSSFTLTINSLTESDANIYCCSESAEKPDDCQQSGISLRVAELQVQVIPATEGHTVTLMCSSSSCPLTESPAAYMWYKNREFLYEDWSHWYQELLSSEEAVTYSCAVKGYEDLRAPEVSVDSITPTCLNVTHVKGEMCSYQEPCSITYPREVRVVRTPGNTLTCSTTCPLTGPQTAYVWFRNGQKTHENQRIPTPDSPSSNLYCAVKGQEHLQSDQVCVQDKNCWRVNYVSRRICALEGSSVNIISEYSYPDNMTPESKFWTKKWRFGDEKVENLIKPSGRVEYHDNMKNQHILTIKNLTKNDSGGYTLRLKKEDEELKQPAQPGVILIVTDLRVEMSRAVVKEAQRVTLTCRTSCPLTDNTNYIWYLNNRPLTLRETQNKHLILDSVSRENAGNYSCAVETNMERFTGKWLLIAAGAFAALLLIMIIILLTACWRRRKKRTSSRYPRSETSESKQEVSPNPVYENISAQYSRMQPTLKCPAELYSNSAELYSNSAGIYSNIVELYSNP